MSDLKIGFGLTGIKTEQFAIFKEQYKPSRAIELITDLAFAINTEDKNVSVIATFSFQQQKNTFLKLATLCQFTIEEKAWESFKGNDKITIPKLFLDHMAMLTVGTARGVLFSKTEGTEFNQFIVPTINVAKMVKGDGVFELSK